MADCFALNPSNLQRLKKFFHLLMIINVSSSSILTNIYDININMPSAKCQHKMDNSKVNVFVLGHQNPISILNKLEQRISLFSLWLHFHILIDEKEYNNIFV